MWMNTLMEWGTSFFASVLAGIGIGSGGIYLMYLVFCKGMGATEARIRNFTVITAALLSSAVSHTAKHVYRDKRVLLSLFFGIPTALLGAYLSDFLAPWLLKKILGVMLIVFGAYPLIFGRTGKSALREKKEGAKEKTS